MWPASPYKSISKKPRYNLFQNTAYMIRTAWGRNRSVLVLCVLLAMLAVVSSLLGLFIAPAIIAEVEAVAPLERLVTVILLFTGGMLLVGALNTYIGRNTLFGRVAVRSVIVSRIHDKICQMSFPLVEDQDVQKRQDTASVTVNSNSSAAEAIWDTLTDLMTNSAGFVIYLVLLASLQWWIVAIVLVTGVVGFLFSRHFNGWGYRHRDVEAEYSRRMNYITRESNKYTLAKDVRIFGMRQWLTDVHDSWMRLYQSFIARRERVYIWGDIIDAVLTLARNGIAYAYLIYLVLNDGLSAAAFLLFFAAVGGFSGWVGGILSNVETLHRQSLDLSNMREFIEWDEPFKFEDGLPLIPETNARYEIKLDNVSFRYPGAEKDTLTGINLTLQPGEKLAIVGLNGAGKTTLVKLICGLYDPTAGHVLLNGQDIRQYNRRDYYKHFSSVFQDFSILPTTITENITQSICAPDEARLRACANDAGLLEKIESYPQGFDTYVTKTVFNEGVELSGGETQRLMLARALYKQAPLLILDEPTAALDPIAEADMYSKYNEFSDGRTSVYISHRLASTRFCDRIILIDGGSITEEGTHDQLIRNGQKYAELFEIQSHYYRDDLVAHAEGSAS
ncbi:MAG: ABC transporter ATP-binding protein/permease [Defluviitaleaceae bacterium]|nr:ABC transporter ATP-binding protein/permease [Defluviitaleaceae bacterium]